MTVRQTYIHQTELICNKECCDFGILSVTVTEWLKKMAGLGGVEELDKWVGLRLGSPIRP